MKYDPKFKYYVLAGTEDLRRKFAVEQLYVHGVTQSRIVMVNFPNFQDVEKEPNFLELVKPLDSKQVSVTLKHYYAVEAISNSPEDYGVIMEDGNLFKSCPDRAVEKYLAEAPDDMDLIFDSDILNLKYSEGPIKKGKSIYKKSNLKDAFCDGSSRGANFIILTRIAAARLRDIFLPIGSVSDMHYNHLIRTLNLNVYWAEPPNVHKIISFYSTVTTRPSGMKPIPWSPT
jgi:hypothetical protein